MTNLDTKSGILLTKNDGFGHELLTLFDGFAGLVLSGIPENSKVKIKIKKKLSAETLGKSGICEHFERFFPF